MDESDEDEGGGQETEDVTSTYEAGGDLWRDEVIRCAGHLPIEDTGTLTVKTQRIEATICLFYSAYIYIFLSVFLQETLRICVEKSSPCPPDSTLTGKAASSETGVLVRKLSQLIPLR